jgi:hypothetical protein
VHLVPSLYYEIRVTGTIPQEVLVDFERITADVEPVETVLHGPLADQAALHGLLARLEMFGAQVIEVRRLRDRARPPEKMPPDKLSRRWGDDREPLPEHQ